MLGFGSAVPLQLSSVLTDLSRCLWIVDSQCRADRLEEGQRGWGSGETGQGRQTQASLSAVFWRIGHHWQAEGVSKGMNVFMWKENRNWKLNIQRQQLHR